MNKTNFYASLLAILVIGGITASFIYQNLSQRPQYSEIKVAKGTIEEALNINGSIRPQEEVALGFELGGKITKLPYAVGNFVKSGTVLAYTNATDLNAQYKQALYLAKSAEANLDQYHELYKKQKAVLDSLKKSATANSADKKAQKEQIDASKAQIEAQEETISAAYANVENAKAQIAKTMIVAPFDGIISTQDLKVGEVPQAGISIITLISQNDYKIEAFVSQIDVKKIEVGDSAKITLDNGASDTYDAKISAIDPAENDINGVPNYKVTFNFSENTSGLRSGLGANISLFIQSKSDTLVIPKDAVFMENDKAYVFVLVNGLREKKEIQTGIQGSDGMVEVLSGLNAGDSIYELAK
ncbi:MAG: efflux RND transporter periplasmic adaptor subunit [Parcubacteria group bacterium]|jgi:RND family efflux transporter MFP subunit